MVESRKGRARSKVIVAFMVASLGCADDAEPPSDNGSSGAATSSSSGTTDDDSTGSTSTTTSTSTTSTTFPATTTSPPVEMTSSSSGMPLPEGPYCSVQVVTHGELTEPLPKGEEVGLFPTSVGHALEDFCGCHTLMTNAQNVEHGGLKAPGNTLWLEYADLQRIVDGGTLGQAMAEEVLSRGMPPGSCSYPEPAADLLEKWFAEGLPDGSNFSPP